MMKPVEYRYELHRHLDNEDYKGDGCLMMFIGLAPDTAPTEYNGPQVRAAMALARAAGCSEMVMCNLFAARIFKPRLLWELAQPVGEENDDRLQARANEALIIVAHWGYEIDPRGRDDEVLKLLGGFGDIMCTGLLDSLQPRATLEGELMVFQEMRLW